MSRIPLLESFDLAEAAPAAAAGPSGEWLLGQAAGRAEAEAAMLDRQDLLSGQIAQNLADLIFTHAQARRHVLDGLGPLFRTLIAKVLPALAQTDFAPHLVQVLSAAANADTGVSLQVHLHPAQLAPVAATLAILPPGQIQLHPDSTLAPDTARIAGAGRETVLDMGQVLADATTVLSALFDHTEPRRDHG